jgi:hypothetical protein
MVALRIGGLVTVRKNLHLIYENISFSLEPSAIE